MTCIVYVLLICAVYIQVVMVIVMIVVMMYVELSSIRLPTSRDSVF